MSKGKVSENGCGYRSEDRYRYWEKTYSDPRAADGKDWYGAWEEFQIDVAGPAFRKSDEPWWSQGSPAERRTTLSTLHVNGLTSMVLEQRFIFV